MINIDFLHYLSVYMQLRSICCDSSMQTVVVSFMLYLKNILLSASIHQPMGSRCLWEIRLLSTGASPCLSSWYLVYRLFWWNKSCNFEFILLSPFFRIGKKDSSCKGIWHRFSGFKIVIVNGTMYYKVYVMVFF
jgi:hypothetical protein